MLAGVATLYFHVVTPRGGVQSQQGWPHAGVDVTLTSFGLPRQCLSSVCLCVGILGVRVFVRVCSCDLYVENVRAAVVAAGLSLLIWDLGVGAAVGIFYTDIVRPRAGKRYTLL